MPWLHHVAVESGAQHPAPGEPLVTTVALWMGLISLWACGYAIETRDLSAEGSGKACERARERPYPVRAQRLNVLAYPALCCEYHGSCADLGMHVTATSAASLSEATTTAGGCR